MITLKASSTLTHKKTANQDYHTNFRNQNLDFNCIIVADGIGSHPKSELSSKFCVSKLREILENIETSDKINFRDIFSIVKNELILYAQNTDDITSDELKSTILGTTLICVLEFEDYYDIAYIGNGSIWHISANFNRFSANQYVPWNSINILNPHIVAENGSTECFISLNLLNPHTVEENGKSALYKYFSTDTHVSVVPTCIRLSKDKDIFGEIIVVASDGLYTNDAILAGKDDNGTVWIKGDENMILFYTMLNSLFINGTNEMTDGDVLLNIDSYLNIIKDKGLMQDDTTIGILISEQALKYQNIKSLIS